VLLLAVGADDGVGVDGDVGSVYDGNAHAMLEV